MKITLVTPDNKTHEIDASTVQEVVDFSQKFDIKDLILIDEGNGKVMEKDDKITKEMIIIAIGADELQRIYE